MPSEDGEKEDAEVPDVLSGPLITIYVGPNKEKWLLHLNLLMDISDFFKNKFSCRTQDSEPLVMYLDADPRAFEIFVGYAYSYVTMEVLGTLVTLSPLDDPKITIHTCVNLYNLADHFAIEHLQEVVSSAVDNYYREGQVMPQPQDAQYIYDKAPGSDMCVHVSSCFMPRAYEAFSRIRQVIHRKEDIKILLQDPILHERIAFELSHAICATSPEISRIADDWAAVFKNTPKLSCDVVKASWELYFRERHLWMTDILRRRAKILRRERGKSRE